jgi:predicted HTH domain antitoxin
MMKEIVLQVPEEMQDMIGQRRDLAKEIIKRLAVSLYAERKISLGKAVELSGTDHFAFMELLRDFGVNLDYDEEDLDEDLRTIRGLKNGGNM